VFCLLTGSVPAQTNDADASAAALKALTNVNEELTRLSTIQLQTLAELQAQQQATLKALEQSRLEIAAALTQSFSNNVAHLTAVTEMLAVQRSQDLKAVRDTHRVELAILVGLSGLLLLSILVLNVTSIRAINRMTAMFSASSLMMPGSEAEALADAREASRQLVLFPGEQGQRQLGNAMVQLQSRIQSLEHLASKMQADSQRPATGGSAAAPSGSSELSFRSRSTSAAS
jgi:hypothetical protein